MTEHQQPSVNDTDENGDEAAPPPANPEQLSISIRDQQDREVMIKLKSNTPMRKAMQAWGAKMERDPKTVRFLVDGVRVSDDSTPASLEIVDGDIVEVHEEQIGGQGGIV